MGVFRQLGDPVCPACLCEHHGAAYEEFQTTENPTSPFVRHESIANATAIVQVQIITTETCCVVTNAACLTGFGWGPGDLNIEQPLGTDRTSQINSVNIADLKLMHHASWEVLPAGTYIYSLVNRSGGPTDVYAAWIKAIASDCEG
jgi:hypothetical protein